MPGDHYMAHVPRLSRAALVVAIIGWLVLAAFGFGYFEGDLASAILGGLGLLVGAGAAYCLGRAIDARGERIGLLWAGRALALFGAAFVILFPAILYGEIVQLVQLGKPQTYDIEAAIWHEFRVMPLTIVPALVGLRWARIGGLLFLFLAAYSVADGLYHFGGVNYYPEGAASLPELLIVNVPALLTAALLFVGSEGWHGEEGRALPRGLMRGAH
jgi:hypothetical protein